jgi:hypothetical protein
MVKQCSLQVIWTVVFFLILFSIASSCSKSEPAKAIEIKVDPRVELMSIIFRLAGNPEYNMGRIQAYVDDVETRFGPFREHDAVLMARRLRETRGVSYDAVMSLALHIKDPFTLEEEIPFEPRPAALEQRWRVDEAREFLVRARDFVRTADFRGFVTAHTDLYRLTQERLQALMEEHEVVAWFHNFFGTLPDARFSIMPGLLNGPGSYGPRVIYPDGREDLFTILGVWMLDSEGLPRFDQRVLGTIVHEFCHSFVNPLVYKHSRDLEEAGETMFRLVEERMRSQAYGSWQTMMCESLVRASVVRWDLATNGEESARNRMDWEEKNHFFWIAGLSELLGDYEAQRDRHPDFVSFFPKILEFFNEYAADAESRIRIIKDRWASERAAMLERSPKIVSLVPADGARDVDPNDSAIVITFDRAMKDKAWGVMRRNGNMPEITGDVFYDASRRVFTIPVKLEPNTDYTVGLNSENALAFQDEKGNPLVPTTFRFTTGPIR